MKKTAVVLFNLGAPYAQKDIKPFLLSLFSDPAILTLPNPFRSILAHLITQKRLKEARLIYSQLGGGSPLLKNTQAQAQALETELGKDYKVFVAMRHAPPFIEEAFFKVKNYDPDEIILLPLYPQYSTTTSGSSYAAWNKAANSWARKTHFIHSYPQLKGFIDCMAKSTLSNYEQAKNWGPPRILFTAHGLPNKIISKGDPYQHQVELTAKTLMNTLGLYSEDMILCYQSRVGPLKWIGPPIDQEVKRAGKENRPLVVVPISFVSEHSETLVELDITYRELALRSGCPVYHRVETVQTDPLFIKGLASLVTEQKK